MATTKTTPTIRRCERCQATDNLRLKDSITLWNETMRTPQQVNIYVCVDRKACSERVNEASHFIKEDDLWTNYHRECRPRRYTPRHYWNDGHRLTFAIAQALFQQAGMKLEKGQKDFPQGLKSGYIINREWRFTSLLEAIKLIEEQKPKRAKKPCRRYTFKKSK
ncbi:MAG: hypothetical protein HS114_34555 [Anaerolineales bacterium]|nr:hypothetical protein [Anaerolineales bacterium]